jgi:acyl carrier protein
MTTTTTDIETTVFKSLEEFGAEPELISREAEFEALDVDSLDLAELTQIVEDEFGVQLQSDDLKGITNVGQVIDLIASRTA